MRSSGQRPRRGQSGENEVFLDVQAAENPTFLMHKLHARLGDGVALSSGDIRAVEHDRAGARRQDAHQALQGRALAGAVAAEQCHHLVARDAQRDIEQNVGIAVIAVQAAGLEQIHAASTPCTPPR